MKIAVLGAGRIAEEHISNILNNRGYELAGFYEPNTQRRQYIENKYKIQSLSYEGILADNTILAVLIATPTPTHCRIIKECVEVGKEIYCEKPLSVDMAEADEIIKYLRERNKLIMLGFNRRFDPAIYNLKSKLKANEIGEIEQLILISRDPGIHSLEFLKNCGGFFFDITLHDFDLIRYLTEQKFIKIYAIGEALFNEDVKEINDIDTANIIIQIESKAMVHINCSRFATYGYDQRIEAFGRGGMLQTNNIKQSQFVKANNDGYLKERMTFNFMERYHQGFVNILDLFLKEFNGNRKYSPNQYDCIKAMRIAQFANKSIKEKIALDIDI